MAFMPLPSSISTRIALGLGVVSALAACVVIVAVRDECRRRTLYEAEAKARIILDHTPSLHGFVPTGPLPAQFKWSDPGLRKFIHPAWLSSSEAFREPDEQSFLFDIKHYYEKHCAINARCPGNEADLHERGFLEQLNADPDLITKSEVVTLDGKPYYSLMSRGLRMEQSCAQCHSIPEKAPAGLVEMYGPQRGFHREQGKIVSAVSIRVELTQAYEAADHFAIRLSIMFLSILAFLFLFQHFLLKGLFLRPLRKLRDKALELAASDEHLGEAIPTASKEEFSELTEAFNRMSASFKARVSERKAAEDALHREQLQLEARVAARTEELSRLNEQLMAEDREKAQIQAALIQERDFVECLVNTAQTIILVLDEQGRIVRFNPYLEKLTGVKLEEVKGQDWFYHFLPLDCRINVRQLFCHALAGGNHMVYANFIRTRDGGMRLIEWCSAEMRNPDGTLLGLLSIGQDITEKKKAEEALKKSEMRLRDLYAQLLKTQEEERRKLSKEVHDSIGSPLAAIKIGLENAVMQHARSSAGGVDSLRALAELAQHSVRECRRIMTDLRPPVLDDYGITVAIRWLCERFEVIYPHIRIEKNIELSEKEIPEFLRIVLFRIVQEALNNAAKHSGANNISVSLKCGEQIELMIRDDGCGFDAAQVMSSKDREAGFGISNMKERTEISGGLFLIETGLECGTAVHARWPY
ncbi:MAG: PAS domain S-box protein [Desulfobacteraceae bacterium]|nr:PAS domain S-box protein [Desulfobacteraceae bacterium]